MARPLKSSKLDRFTLVDCVPYKYSKIMSRQARLLNLPGNPWTTFKKEIGKKVTRSHTFLSFGPSRNARAFGKTFGLKLCPNMAWRVLR